MPMPVPDEVKNMPAMQEERYDSAFGSICESGLGSMMESMSPTSKQQGIL